MRNVFYGSEFSFHRIFPLYARVANKLSLLRMSIKMLCTHCKETSLLCLINKIENSQSIDRLISVIF